MHRERIPNIAGAVAALAMLAGCAVIEDSISAPDVALTSVQLEKLGFSEQTFRLSFDVSNPNPFPLPVKSIGYGVELDGHRFASGETECDILVKASGDGEFVISVDLDLLTTAPELLALVRDSNRRDIPYSIEGRIGLDLPATRPLRFEHNGQIRLTAGLE